MHWGYRTAACGSFAIILLTAATASATVTYRIFNHPNGNQIQTSVDADGYAFRLDGSTSGPVHTFNANHTELFFSWEPGGTTARIFGQVSHNESGDDSNNYDANDDIWNIDLAMNTTANFRDVRLTDESGVTEWFDGHSDSETFDDMFAELLSDANDPDPGAERSTFFDEDVARIYFRHNDFSMNLASGEGDYDGETEWSEFPNDGSKLFFIQYRWRLWDAEFASSDYDMLGAAGWLEHFPDGAGTPAGCCQDFLFVVGDRVDVPEPASTTLFATALVFLGIARRRRNGR